MSYSSHNYAYCLRGTSVTACSHTISVLAEVAHYVIMSHTQHEATANLTRCGYLPLPFPFPPSMPNDSSNYTYYLQDNVCDCLL